MGGLGRRPDLHNKQLLCIFLDLPQTLVTSPQEHESLKLDFRYCKTGGAFDTFNQDHQDHQNNQDNHNVKQAAPLTRFIVSWETHKCQGFVMVVVGQQQLAALDLCYLPVCTFANISGYLLMLHKSNRFCCPSIAWELPLVIQQAVGIRQQRNQLILELNNFSFRFSIRLIPFSVCPWRVYE